MKQRFYLIWVLCIVQLSYTQDAKPDAYQDSLQNIIDSNSLKTIKKETLFLLGEHLVQRDPDYAETIASDLKNRYINTADSNEVRRANYIFAASHRWQGDYKTALQYYQKIYNYSLQKKDSIDVAKSAHFMGSINMFLGNNVRSQKYLIEASSIYDKIGTAEQRADINNSLAGFYLNIDQLEKGKDKYLLALEQFKRLQDSAGMASSNANLGMLYTELGDFEKAEYHLMQQKNYNAVFPTLREMGFHYDFLGLLRQEQGRLQEAYNEHLRALNIRENLSSTYNLCESKLNMSEVLIKLGRYKEAITHLKDVFAYDEHDSLYQQLAAYDLLAEAYEKSGNHKKALDNFKLYTTINDSIYSKESLEIIAEKDARYNQQKKDAEITLLNKEKEISEARLSRSRLLMLIALIVLFFLALGAFSLWNFNKKMKRKNATITKALQDRELLLHETHHRVKNNLQMISSLLNLQSKYVKDDQVLEVLQNGRNRVQSMAILHKNLYAGEDLNMVNLQHYFEGLADSILNSYHKTTHDVNLNINAHDVKMDVESVIPLGLIVNELVTNSLKHAFPKATKAKPEIVIKMAEREDFYTLKVADNGVGIHDNFIENGSKESFGQRLINSLSKKLKATLSVTNNNGTSVSFVFPK